LDADRRRRKFGGVIGTTHLEGIFIKASPESGIAERGMGNRRGLPPKNSGERRRENGQFLSPFSLLRVVSASGLWYQDRGPAELAAPEPVERLVGGAEGKRLGGGPHRGAGEQREELLPIAPGEIRNRPDGAFSPEQFVGE
jgi:hypothetical protein